MAVVGEAINSRQRPDFGQVNSRSVKYKDIINWMGTAQLFKEMRLHKRQLC